MPQQTPAFFSHGHAVDLVLAVILLEFVALSATRVRSHGRLLDRLFAYAPGICLLLALRAALTGSSWVWVAVFLTASFPVHIGDLVRRRL
ncbi:MAG: hypothetical protein ACYDD1_06470 [Caulobacteraceae bacterium]